MQKMTAASVNYALNRPALQSSVSRWSSSQEPETAARDANNGDLALDFGCHTAEEERPWWQVDLGTEIAIERIAIFNRQKCAYRLRYFSLYASFDGKKWRCFHKRTDSLVFGERLDDVLVIVPENTVITRFVRLQLDIQETLHFREFEVYGRTPTPEDYRQFELQNNPIPRLQALAAGRTGSFVKLGKRAIFVDEVNCHPRVAAAIKQRRYRRKMRQLADRMILPPDRVLEAGTALGVVTMFAANRTSPQQVRTFDSDPYIIEDAKRNFIFNQMAGIGCVPGALKNRKHLNPSEKTIKFAVGKEFWASRAEIVEVPVFCLEDEIAAHRANVLIIDLKGGEIDLLDGAELSSIRLIIMATRNREADAKATYGMIGQLMSQGFKKVSHAPGGAVVLRRDLENHRGSALSKLVRRLAVLRQTVNRRFQPGRRTT